MSLSAEGLAYVSQMHQMGAYNGAQQGYMYNQMLQQACQQFGVNPDDILAQQNYANQLRPLDGKYSLRGPKMHYVATRYGAEMQRQQHEAELAKLNCQLQMQNVQMQANMDWIARYVESEGRAIKSDADHGSGCGCRTCVTRRNKERYEQEQYQRDSVPKYRLPDIAPRPAQFRMWLAKWGLRLLSLVDLGATLARLLFN